MSLRQRIWIDGRIQGILVGRFIIYWLCAVVFFGTGIAVTQYCDHSDWTFAEHTQALIGKFYPWAPSACLLLPLVIYDIIRTSHAFTGPIGRVRQQLAKLLQNPNCTPLVLRQDDFLQDITGPVNSLQHQILSLHLALQKQRDLIVELRSKSDKHVATSATEAAQNLAQIPKHDLDAAVQPKSAEEVADSSQESGTQSSDSDTAQLVQSMTAAS